MKIKKQIRIIKELRKIIPSFECGNCHTCCGPVPFSYYEKKLAEEIAGARAISKNMVCPYVDKVKGCLIYDERPIICRLYGAVDYVGRVLMLCPNGYGPKQKLTKQQGNIIKARYSLTKPKVIEFDEGLSREFVDKRIVSEIMHEGF